MEKDMQQQQWLEWRRQGIGASDAPIVMGVSPFKTINQLWREKVLGITQKENAAMARGNALEDPALNFFMKETGYFLNTQVKIEHPHKPWMRATLDGYDNDNQVAVEIKSCKKLHTEVPDHYYPQLQHQLEVTGDQWMYYMSFDGVDGHILKVSRDDEYILEMMEKEELFWEEVKKGVRNMQGHEEWKAHVQGLMEAKEMIKEAKEKESFHLSQMILFSEGSPAYGEGALLTRAQRKGSVNYAVIPELQGVNLDSYRKPSARYWSVDFSDIYISEQAKNTA